MKRLLTAIVGLAIASAPAARAHAEPVDVRVDVEPAAYLLEGYSIHLASTLPPAPRVTVGGTLYGFAVPSFLVEMGDNDGDAWDVRLRVGYGVFADMFLGDRRDGWLVGGQIGLQQYRARGLGTDAIFTNVMTLVRAAYEWHPRPSSGGYLMPWVGAAWTTTVSGSSGAYRVFPVLPYFACDLGWRF